MWVCDISHRRMRRGTYFSIVVQHDRHALASIGLGPKLGLSSVLQVIY